jgi:nucleoside-diphosphate-sugar epimerase
MATYLTTGGAGFIGARLLEKAHPHHTLHNIVHTRPTAYGTDHPASLTDADAVKQAVTATAPDAILHLAAAGVARGKQDLGHMLSVNVLGLQAMLEAAVTLPAPPHIVIAGSWFEYAPVMAPRPLTEGDRLSAKLPYSASKIAAAIVAQHYTHRVPITVLRVFSVYGVGEPLPRLAPYIVQQTLHGTPVDLTACEQVRDYLDADEVAVGFLRAAANPPTDGELRVLNLGTGHGITLQDFVAQIGTALTDAGYTPRFNFGARPYREDEAMHAVADVTRLRETLGWVPTTTPATGIPRAVAAHLAALG